MNKNSRRYPITLSLVWLFAIVYTGGFLLKVHVLPFPKWMEAVYEPIYQFIFGGSS